MPKKKKIGGERGHNSGALGTRYKSSERSHRARAESPQRTAPGPAKSRKHDKKRNGNFPKGSSIRLRSTKRGRTAERNIRKTAEFKRRSAAAKKGWETRRRKAQKAKRPNQEYILTVIATAAKSKTKARQWDLFVIGPTKVSKAEIIRWTIWWIENHPDEQEKDLQWIADIMNYYSPPCEVTVAHGPLARRRRVVKLRT